MSGRCLLAVLALGIALGTGCSSSGESASRDTLTADVGKFPPAPKGLVKPRVGVPPFNVTTGTGFLAGKDLNELAADQMSTLMDQSDRFEVIERAKLQNLLAEQNLEGIVIAGEMARPGQVRGVDYLLLGKVTNLRMKTERKQRGFGLAQMGGLVGGADYKKKDVIITTECGVDIRLVDPTTGQVLPGTSNFSEFKRVDTAGAIGIDILGASADADADIQISEDDKGKVLRLALNDALMKRLPSIDKALLKRSQSAGAAPANAAAPSKAAVAAPAPSPAVAAPAAPEAPVARKFCAECGQEMAAAAKFCASCGAKAE